jgi:hypothetical protein
VIAAREVFTRARQIYIRPHESCRPLLGSLLFLKEKKKAIFRGKTNFSYVRPFSFPIIGHSSSGSRLFMKREND